jgi:hypothetical protein
MKKLMILFSGFFLFVAISSAQTDCTFEYSNTSQLLSSFEQINSKLSNCNVSITEDLSIGEDRISSVNSGAPQQYSYAILVTEDALDSILQSDNMASSFFTSLDRGNIAVDPQGFMATMTWFFAKLFF